jgi:hypothetical protein
MHGAGSAMRLGLAGVVSVACVACGPAAGSGPADSQGTRDTALQLVLGGDAALDERVPIKLCLNPDGLCVPSEYRVDECHRYDDIEADIDGVSIPRTSNGGWSSIPRFAPLPSGGNGYGCSYPAFALDSFGVPANAHTQTLTIKIHGQTIVAIAKDWLIERSLTAPSTFVKGTDVFVGLQPNVGSEQRQTKAQATYFLYDDTSLDEAWCTAKGVCGPVTTPPEVCTCLDAFLSDVHDSAWTDAGFLLRVPTSMPVGTGRFGFGEAWARVEVSTCPFIDCELTVNRGAEIAGITIAEP